MRLHANARLSPIGRRLLVDRIERDGWTVREAAEAQGVCERTAYRVLARWRAEGEAGLVDRSSAPRRIPHKTSPERERAIVALRRLRMTAAQIAEVLGMALSTVCAVLKRVGLGKRSRLEPLEPPNRYERRRAGELVHIDIKKLGRIARPGWRLLGRSARGQAGYHRQANQLGWEFVHVAVDDHSRLAYAEVLSDQKATTAVAFLRRAQAFYARNGISVERVMTDNGSAYRSTLHRARLRNARHPPPTHPPLPAADQRQSRALHPDPPRANGPTHASTANSPNAPPP